VNAPGHARRSRPLLALDTATPLGTVAIGRAGDLIAEVTMGVHTRHAESLLPAIDFAVRCAGLERNDIAGIVVGSGPGSFTGVRIAGATAKGLAHALGLPLYAFSSLTMVAAGAGASGSVCALFDARRGEVYASCHRFSQGAGGEHIVETVVAPCAIAVDDLVETLRPQDPLYVGEGALRHAAVIAASGGRLGHDRLAIPRASALLWLFDVVGEASRVTEPARWTPEYLRAPGARVPGPPPGSSEHSPVRT
jgi:tRNA threonylcarbamoyl adenosine modification protein YeaZ